LGRIFEFFGRKFDGLQLRIFGAYKMEQIVFSSICGKDLSSYSAGTVDACRPIFELQMRQLRFEAAKCIPSPRLLILLQNFRFFVSSNALPQSW
jgi:hypothetical protein